MKIGKKFLHVANVNTYYIIICVIGIGGPQEFPKGEDLSKSYHSEAEILKKQKSAKRKKFLSQIFKARRMVQDKSLSLSLI